MADRKTLYLAIQAETEITREQLKQLGVSLRQAGVDADASLDKIERRFDQFGGRTKQSLGSAFAGGFIGGLVSQLSTGLLAAVEASGKFGEKLKQTAANTDLSTRAIQEFRFAVGQSGGDAGKAEEGLISLNQAVGKARNGNKEYADTFKELGVRLTDSRGRALPLEQILRQTADGFANFGNKAQAAEAAQLLFQGAATAIVPALQRGSQGLDDFAASAAKLGVVLSEGEVERLAEFGQKSEALKQVLSLELAAAVGANSDALLKLASALFKAAGGLAEFASQDPDRIREIAGAAAGALVGSRVAGLPGAAIGAAIGNAGAADAQLAGTSAIYGKDRERYGLIGGTIAGTFDVLTSSRQTLIKAAKEAEAVRMRGALPTPVEQQLSKNFPLSRFSAGSGTVRNRRAQEVIDQLLSKAAADGDPRKLAIAAALQQAGVEPGSAEGKRISMLAGQVYDAGPGAQKAEADARKAAAKAKADDRARLAASRAEAAGDKAVDRARLGLLAAQADATGDPAARFAVEKERIETARDTLKEETAQRVANKQLTAAQGRKLAALADQTAAAELTALSNREEARKADEAFQLLQTRLAGQRDELQAELELATNRRDRQRIEEQLLDLKLQQLKAEVDNLKALQKLGQATQGQVDAAQARVDQANATAPLQRQSIERQNEGPLARYRRQLETEGANIEDAFEQIAVNGFGRVDSAVEQSIGKIRVFGGVIDDILNGILQDFTKLATHQLFRSLLGGGGGGGGGDIFSSLLSAGISAFGGAGGPSVDAASSFFARNSASVFSGLRFAAGGDPPVGLASLVGEEGPELFVPRLPGTIIPNHRLGGLGGGGDYFDLRGAVVTEELLNQVNRRVAAGAVASISGGKLGGRAEVNRVTRPRLPGSRAA
ncbi:MAG: hypothetical protein RQ833_11510 [Sphingomonadaceae bacterium]|nr:hypothetical protein [Sphingomonadaceae bacterium]